MLNYRDIPQGVILCLAIYAVFKKKKKEEKVNFKIVIFSSLSLSLSLSVQVPLAWVNQPLFDYRSQLCTGIKTLPCWVVSAEDTLEDLLNPIGI